MCLFIYISIHHPPTYLPALPIYLSISLFIILPTIACLSYYQIICLSIYTSTNPSSIYPHTYTNTYIFMYKSINLPFYINIYQPTYIKYLPVYLSIRLSLSIYLYIYQSISLHGPKLFL